MKLSLFATCAPGLEQLLAAELHALLPVDSHLHPQDIQVHSGGVAYTGSSETLAHSLIGLGLAARLLVRVAEFPVRHLNELEKKIAAMDWRAWLTKQSPRTLRATARKSRLYHTGAITERISRAISAALGEGPAKNAWRTESRELPNEDHSTDAAATMWPGVVARIENDLCLISLDVSGAPLHRRGYRRNPYRAPLREDIARALIIASGWDGKTGLVDPCCGSGTLLVEAAVWATGWPPGWLRSFALEQTPLGSDRLISDVKYQRLSAMASKFKKGNAMESLQLYAADRDPEAIKVATANWLAWPWNAAVNNPSATPVDNRVSVLEFPTPQIEFQTQDIHQLELPHQAMWIVTNPPWGTRVAAATGVYRRLGELCRSIQHGRLALVTNDRKLAYKTGVPLHSAFLTDAGGIKINACVDQFT